MEKRLAAGLLFFEQLARLVKVSGLRSSGRKLVADHFAEGHINLQNGPRTRDTPPRLFRVHVCRYSQENATLATRGCQTCRVPGGNASWCAQGGRSFGAHSRLGSLTVGEGFGQRHPVDMDIARDGADVKKKAAISSFSRDFPLDGRPPGASTAGWWRCFRRRCGREDRIPNPEGLAR